MPTLDISKKDLESLVGKKFSQGQLEEALLFVKGEIDGMEGDIIKVDVKETNRPDLWSAEGIAREMRARMGIERGIKEYKVGRGSLRVTIEKSVKGVRPFTVGAVVKGVKVTDELLRQIIQLQEKVDGTFGRKRKESSTGIYDYDKIRGNIRYYGAKPREKKFIPLGYRAEMDLEEILLMHPKGKEYAGLLEGKALYPIFEDSEGNVLSMPPVINSDYSGKVTQKTRNLFVEVSGFNLDTISVGLNVIVMALADRGGKVETVTVIDADGKKYATPQFKRKKIGVEIGYIGKITGLDLKEKEMISLLERARYNVRKSGKKLMLEYASHRKDILHPVDIVEDILIGYGYNKIGTLQPKMAVTGGERKETPYLDKVRDACIGLGLQEVLTFVLTSKEKQEKMCGLKGGEFVEIANPVSSNWEIMRKSVYPELLDFLSKNKHAEYPQRIFEAGKTVELDASSDTKTRERNRLCVVMAGKGYGFTLIKSVLMAVCRDLGKKCGLRETSHQSLKDGRRAEITGDTSGIIGELSEEVKKNFGLEQDVVLLEMEV